MIRNVSGTTRTFYAYWQVAISGGNGHRSWHIYTPEYLQDWITAGGIYTHTASMTLANNQTWNLVQDGWGGSGSSTRTYWVRVSSSPINGVYTSTPTPTVTSTFTPTATYTPTSTPTPDNWQTGNQKESAYGVRAYISTPPQAPYLVDLPFSGESSWVSTSGPYWVQTGWHYYYAYVGGHAWSYVERNDPVVGKQIQDISIQNWGTTTEYRVEWLNGATWCAFIGNVQIGCYDIIDSTGIPPKTVIAHSEIHTSPQNALDTNFSLVYYRNASGTWALFDKARWLEQAPYQIDKYNYYDYHNFGP